MITRSSDNAVHEQLGPAPVFRPEVQAHFQTLLRRVGWPGHAASETLRTLGVTSSCRGEGVSTVAAQLAMTAASCGKYRVLLVDANMEHPMVPRILGVSPEPGLAESLSDGDSMPIRIQPSAVANLSVLAAGKVNGSALWQYESAGLARVVGELREDFDLVVFDMPAAGERDSAIRLAGLLDGVVLVVEAERASRDLTRRAAALLTQGNARLLGAVLNKQK